MNGGAAVDFEHERHSHVDARQEVGPARTADHHGDGLNARLALRITRAVGTMHAAYTFLAFALVALPSALGLHWLPDRTLILVAWLSQTLIQLVMLAILQLGQNVQSAAADARAEATYLDAEAILHEVLEVHRHIDHLEATVAPTDPNPAA